MFNSNKKKKNFSIILSSMREWFCRMYAKPQNRTWNFAAVLHSMGLDGFNFFVAAWFSRFGTHELHYNAFPKALVIAATFAGPKLSPHAINKNNDDNEEWMERGGCWIERTVRKIESRKDSADKRQSKKKGISGSSSEETKREKSEHREQNQPKSGCGIDEMQWLCNSHFSAKTKNSLKVHLYFVEKVFQLIVCEYKYARSLRSIHQSRPTAVQTIEWPNIVARAAHSPFLDSIYSPPKCSSSIFFSLDAGVRFARHSKIVY